MPGLPVRATLLALAAALAACDRGNAPSDAPPLSVKVAVVSQEGVPLYIEHTGTTEAVKSVDLRARVQGFLVQAPFKEGADVQEGDLLFVIEQAPYRTALDQAKAALARAQAAFDVGAERLQAGLRARQAGRLQPLGARQGDRRARRDGGRGARSAGGARKGGARLLLHGGARAVLGPHREVARRRRQRRRLERRNRAREPRAARPHLRLLRRARTRAARGAEAAQRGRVRAARPDPGAARAGRRRRVPARRQDRLRRQHGRSRTPARCACG